MSVPGHLLSPDGKECYVCAEESVREDVVLAVCGLGVGYARARECTEDLLVEVRAEGTRAATWTLCAQHRKRDPDERD